jgi:hypothetical protein
VLIKDQDPDREEDGEAAGADEGLVNSKVRMLPHGQTITVDHAWEFVPYNDARYDSLATPAFKTAARPLAQRLNQSVPENDRQAALEALTTLYDETFKTAGPKPITPYRRNVISLFLYSGPIGRVALVDLEERIPRHRLREIHVEPPRSWWSSDRFGQMFTGDGFLKTNPKWTCFETFFKNHGRLHRAGVFQVMHHGSKYNWHSGLAASLSPVASIFCSDPAGQYGHPSADVLLDFEHFNPKQVDAFHGWRVIGRYIFN